MSVSLAPVPRQQYTDANGNPIVGGQLFTYLTNSSTKAATYKSGDGLTANTNPIILDSQGRIPYGLFLLNGVSYKFVLALATDTDPPGSPIFSENDITGINDSTAVDSSYATLAAAISDMANDSILSATEKSNLRKEWDAIASEKAILEAQADTYSITTEKATYTAAWNALATYLNNGVTWVSGVPAWLSDAQLGTDTTIVATTFRLTFKTYYDSRTSLVRKVTDVANANIIVAATTATWTGVASRPTSLVTLNSTDGAVLAAADANSTAALAAISDMASDGILSAVEKPSCRKEWDAIASEKSILEAQATTFGITTEKTTYSNAWQALATYLNNGTTWTTGIPTWLADANLTTPTAITGSTFRSTFKTYYDARVSLIKKITDMSLPDSSNLRVGIGGNLVPNSDFSSGIESWSLNWNEGGGTNYDIIKDYGSPDWVPSGGHAIGIPRTGTTLAASGHLEISGMRINVIPSTRYETYAYIANHRCTTEFSIVYRKLVSGVATEISRTVYGPSSSGSTGGQNLSYWERLGGFVTTPSDCTEVTLLIKGGAALSADPVFWATKLYLAQAGPAQTELSPWSDGSRTGALAERNTVSTVHIDPDSIALNEKVLDNNEYNLTVPASSDLAVGVTVLSSTSLVLTAADVETLRILSFGVRFYKGGSGDANGRMSLHITDDGGTTTYGACFAPPTHVYGGSMSNAVTLMFPSGYVLPANTTKTLNIVVKLINGAGSTNYWASGSYPKVDAVWISSTGGKR